MRQTNTNDSEKEDLRETPEHLWDHIEQQGHGPVTTSLSLEKIITAHMEPFWGATSNPPPPAREGVFYQKLLATVERHRHYPHKNSCRYSEPGPCQGKDGGCVNSLVCNQTGKCCWPAP